MIISFYGMPVGPEVFVVLLYCRCHVPEPVSWNDKDRFFGFHIEVRAGKPWVILRASPMSGFGLV